ncbi:MAG: hypothetical protein ACHRHE_11260 [Tepidisphaerales bacterium]
MKSICTGLGLLGSGKESVEQLGRKLARQADLSEKDGEKIARRLRDSSEKAADALHKTLQSQVSKVLSAVRAATRELAGSGGKKPSHRRRSKRRKAAANQISTTPGTP